MKLLLLAGTAEARALAVRLARDPRLEVVASLAGETAAPAGLGVPTRVGGFGGERAQEDYIARGGFDAVIDATHPFAHAISWRTKGICARLGLPCLHLLRPGWRPGPGDRWSFVDGPGAVAGALPPDGAVFLAVGRKTLPELDALAGRRLFARVIDPPDAPFPIAGGAWVVGRPPFTPGDEMRLFRDLGIGAVVAKDSGGEAGRAKLVAARAMRLPVVLIRRLPPPPGEKAETAEAAAAWVERLL